MAVEELVEKIRAGKKWIIKLEKKCEVLEAENQLAKEELLATKAANHSIAGKVHYFYFKIVS